MFPQERQQLLARTVDGQLLRQETLELQHVLEQNFPQATSLTRLMNIKVENAWSVNVTSITEFIKHVERFTTNFEQADDETAEGNNKIMLNRYDEW